MKTPVTDQLSALAHERRLDVFRLLMRRYPDAVPAGEIASVLNLKPNTASVYLSSLRHAGLVSQTRQGTFQLYQVRLDKVQALFDKMLNDCFRSRPDISAGTERLARPIQRVENGEPVRVLFLCRRNSARSILAEAALRAAGPRFEAHSAGITPASAPHPLALDVLQSNGIDTDGLSSDPVDTYLQGGLEMDVVITVCDDTANGDVTAWPGNPIHAHWGIPDPLECDTDAQRLDVMHAAFKTIRRQIDTLIALPLDTMAAGELQAHLDNIGRPDPIAWAS